MKLSKNGNNEEKFVSTEGHSKLQKKSIWESLSLKLAFFSRRRIFHETGRRRGNLRYFWVRNSSAARNREPGRQNGFSNPKNSKIHFGGPVRDFGPRNRISHPKITQISPDDGPFREKRVVEKKCEFKGQIFPNAIFCSLECPSVETKYFFAISILAFKTAPVIRFPAFRPL